MTSAFAAEYGNAVSGVFDLKMREGNHDKHEFLGQVGFNGFEFGAEGPISRKHNASYLINYRYSTLGFFDLLGISIGTGSAIPKYQDISFKVASKLAGGKISLFGLGGNSGINLLDSESKEEDEDNFYQNEGFDIYNKNRQGVLGLNYFRRFGEKTYAELTLAADGLQNRSTLDTLLDDNGAKQLYSLSDYNTENYTASFRINTKFNSRLTARFGAEVKNICFTLKDSVYFSKYDAFFNVFNDKGNTNLIRLYSQFNLKIAQNLSVIGGVHLMTLTLNNETNFEPRIALKYKPLPNHSFSVGYGNHSKILPMFVYFRRIDLNEHDFTQPNKKLEMMKANHFIASWDWQINEFTRIKVEGYYQHLYNAAIEKNRSSFSMLNNNSFQFSIPDTMVNGGTGDNKGVEITIERFMNKGMYFLVTTSVFDSKYKGSDKISRSTAFDGGYVFNALGGKEFKLAGKKETVRNYLSADMKFTAAGGQRYTPVDVAASAIKGETVYNDSKAYSKKFRDYIRLDIRVAYRNDYRKFSQEFAVDVQNVLNRKNPLYMQYNTKTGKTEFVNQLTIFPMMQYRIIF
jgi:hypothetical protein